MVNGWPVGIRLPLTHWAESLTDKWENSSDHADKWRYFSLRGTRECYSGWMNDINRSDINKSRLTFRGSLHWQGDQHSKLSLYGFANGHVSVAVEELWCFFLIHLYFQEKGGAASTYVTVWFVMWPYYLIIIINNIILTCSDQVS